MTGLSTPTQRKGFASRSSAFTVSAGILLSRLLGLARDRVFAHYFGNSNAADAFRGAFRIPNFLQTLFGEGVLSASFIPVYARLRAEGRHEEASQLAEAIFAILFFIGSLVTLAGVFAAPWLIDGMVPGDPEQPPKIFPLLYCAGDLERGYDRCSVMEGWTRWGVTARHYYFHRFCYRQRPAVCSTVADGDGVSATVASAIHIRQRACADRGAKFFPGIPEP